MSKENFEIYGNVGNYITDAGVISFQIGETPGMFGTPGPSTWSGVGFRPHEHLWMGIQGFQVCLRGRQGTLCDEITKEIKENRLLPRLYSKQIKMLYGHGPMAFRNVVEDGKLRRRYEQIPEVEAWLGSWAANGMRSVQEFCLSCIKNYYYFGDFFVKWRFSRGKRLGVGLPVAGLESMENKNCMLATRRTDVATSLVDYSDLDHVAVGRWFGGAGSYKVYPRFELNHAGEYLYAAISHHRSKSVDEFYGSNETHQGARPYIQGSNKTAVYMNSFLRNSLAAKIHIIIPNAWVESKRNQIMKLCEENKRRKAKNLELVKYNGIEIGTEMRESVLVKYIRQELSKFGEYLSGEENQGKAYSTFSFTDSAGHEQAWRIENIDLKYKEYVEALIAYDKRAEQALLSSVGLDASISAVSKDGVISKSGSDSYYNYLIYIMSLTPEDEVCAEPLNQALRMNFPQLYADGVRIGFYREVPQRQEDIEPQNRLNRQQS